MHKTKTENMKENQNSERGKKKMEKEEEEEEKSRRKLLDSDAKADRWGSRPPEGGRSAPEAILTTSRPKARDGHRYPCPALVFFDDGCYVSRAAAPEGTGGDGVL